MIGTSLRETIPAVTPGKGIELDRTGPRRVGEMSVGWRVAKGAPRRLGSGRDDS
jgi:hypothetical protein